MISSQLFRCVSISSIYRISELGRSTNFGTKKLPKIILFEWSNLVNTLLKKNWRGDRGGQKNIVTKKMTKVYPVEAFCHQKMTKAYPAKAFSNQSLPSAYASSKPLQTRYHIKPIYYAVDHCLMARWSYEIIVSHADITGCKNHLAEKSCKKLPLVKFLPSWGLKEVWSTRHQKWWITRLWSFLHPSSPTTTYWPRMLGDISADSYRSLMTLWIHWLTIFARYPARGSLPPQHFFQLVLIWFKWYKRGK